MEDMKTQDWPREPWSVELVDGRSRWGIESADGLLFMKTGERSRLDRAVAAVNAMRGWDAPLGAVDSLIRRVREAVEYLGDHSDGLSAAEVAELAGALKAAPSQFESVRRP